MEYSFIRTVDDPDEKLEISVRDFGLGEWMIWLDEWMIWLDEWMIWLDEWIIGWMNEWFDEWMFFSMNVLMNNDLMNDYGDEWMIWRMNDLMK